jgi:cytochrome c oxidase subunit 2
MILPALPRRPVPRRRLLGAALSAALVVLPVLLAGLALAGPALAGVVTPDSNASPNAEDISTLYKVTLYVALVIFVIVEGTLIWSLVRHRARRGAADAVQVRGNTPLELGWTLAAALILVVLATVTFLYLDGIKNPAPSGPSGLQAQKAQFAAIDQPSPPKDGGRTLNIKVNGQQYVWRYQYPGKQPTFSYYEMVVPTNTTVTLDITSSDVIHSWWIPRLGPKADAVPGYTNHNWFKIKKAGVYPGNCAELCGEGHADMRMQVRAVSPGEYEAWTQRQREGILASQKALSEQRKQRAKTGQVQ